MKIIILITSLVVVSAIVWIVVDFQPKRGCGIPRWHAEMSALETALERYKYDFGTFPQGSSLEISQALTQKKESGTVYFEWKENQYKEGQLLDPWGRPYQFSYLEDGYPFIRSFGPDGILSEDDKTNR